VARCSVTIRCRGAGRCRSNTCRAVQSAAIPSFRAAPRLVRTGIRCRKRRELGSCPAADQAPTTRRGPEQLRTRPEIIKYGAAGRHLMSSARESGDPVTAWVPAFAGMTTNTEDYSQLMQLIRRVS
jgi:hypothetical protein